MLKNARSTEKVLKLAKGLSCPTCEATKREKSHRVANHDMVGFNDKVCMDKFEVELPWRKLKMLNVVDEASRS